MEDSFSESDEAKINDERESPPPPPFLQERANSPADFKQKKVWDKMRTDVLRRKSQFSTDIKRKKTAMAQKISAVGDGIKQGLDITNAANKAKERDMVISQPSLVDHKVYLGEDLAWSSTEDFELVKVVGEGSYGKVYKGIHLPTGSVFAIKVITVAETESITKEINILKQCKSPYIVNYFGTCKAENPNSPVPDVWVMMDFCEAGSVRDLMQVLEVTLNEKQIAVILRDTLHGLDYLHSNNIIHRDVKAANVLLTAKGEPKLTDFGVSEQLGQMSTGYTGTPLWMAPEVIKKNCTPTTKCDIWSLGITAIEMADGLPPLSDINPIRAMVMVPHLPSPTVNDPKKWSKEFLDFISKCLIKDPAVRPTARQLLDHPFIRKAKEGTDIIREMIESCDSSSILHRAQMLKSSYKNLLANWDKKKLLKRFGLITEEDMGDAPSLIPGKNSGRDFGQSPGDEASPVPSGLLSDNQSPGDGAPRKARVKKKRSMPSSPSNSRTNLLDTSADPLSSSNSRYQVQMVPAFTQTDSVPSSQPYNPFRLENMVFILVVILVHGILTTLMKWA
mmetsp:Transcript_49867/g.125342  ORF Transcript_49867/g.125342 Transcript_49867/m.125342 type:complete len:562 (+) Transcript_49867:180-1865(+)|eukprot:CAMPEP_0177630036 /NCGR_PEP_ID=MMETSP0447-20121125/995_1 /TAXON_ID=0 /ORGANISM="Stygamoeba regulata, Strain BSH-02190019" /LENGTH=561 /DNA_ID=CAMNT_0019131413 /DNA_START=149 /DNA_END=1834 /DNA_ORIENTATION=-